MPSSAAAAAARGASRDAMAVTSQRSDRCIAGITLFTAIAAQPRMPQRTRSVMPPSYHAPRSPRSTVETAVVGAPISD
jgi:hypothetical protein